MTRKHQDAFDALKEALSTAPVLGYPDFSREFILETDTSLNGLDATVLSQQVQGKRNPCVYHTQTTPYITLKDLCAQL